MKSFPSNPRQITKKRASRLQDTLARLGDLSGIVHNLETDEIAGGHQRLRVMFGEQAGEFRVSDADIEIVMQLDAPDSQGTVAHGFLIWRGGRYAYRQVRWDAETMREANIAANLGAGAWDFDVLANEWDVGELGDWGFDESLLSEWGQGYSALSEMLASVEDDLVDEPEPQIDRAAELREKWGVESGQLWRIPSRATGGEHRIICGDCTDAAVVERVMQGERAQLVFTDPPYGIGKCIINDDLDRDNLMVLYRNFTDVALRYVVDNAYVYVWGYFETLSDYWQNIVRPRGDCNFRDFIIWHKPNPHGRNVSTFRKFPLAYEAALLYIFGQPFRNGPWGTAPNAEHFWDGFEPLRLYLDNERKKVGWSARDVEQITGVKMYSHWFTRSQWTLITKDHYEKLKTAARGGAFVREYDDLRREYDDLRREYDDLRGYFDNSFGWTNVWQVDNVATTDLHPTVKPIEVYTRGIMTTCESGNIVYDPFLGSGTAIVACERTGRLGRGVEIAPEYVAVSLERLAEMGLQPELMETH